MSILETVDERREKHEDVYKPRKSTGLGGLKVCNWVQNGHIQTRRSGQTARMQAVIHNEQYALIPKRAFFTFRPKTTET